MAGPEDPQGRGGTERPAGPEVFVLSGPDVGRSFAVADGATFGRAAECTVRLRGPSISRLHARLERRDRGWELVDAASRNGLFAEREGLERVERVELSDGAEVRLGDVALRFRTRVRAADAPDSASAGTQERAIARRAPEPEPDAEPELEFEDEIELDVDEDPEFIAGGGAGGGSARRSRSAPDAAPAAVEREAATEFVPRRDLGERRSPRGTQARAASAPPSGGVGGHRTLQYHRVEDRPGLMGADLAQVPLALRWLAYLLVIGFAVGLAYLAFRAITAL